MSWLNEDGLYVRFAGELRQVNGGELPSAGEYRVIQTKFNVADIGTGATILDDTVIIPRNSRIEQVELVSE